VANYRQAVLSAFQAVEDNLAALRILAQEAGQEHTAVASAEHYLSLAQTRYRAGIDSSLNVEVAQTLLLTNRETEVQVQLREVQSSIALVMALGGGWDVSQLPAKSDMSAHTPKWRPASDSPRRRRNRRRSQPIAVAVRPEEEDLRPPVLKLRRLAEEKPQASSIEFYSILEA